MGVVGAVMVVRQLGCRCDEGEMTTAGVSQVNHDGSTLTKARWRLVGLVL